MSLILDRLLFMLSVPLFAVSKRKKKVVKKPAQKKLKPKRASKQPAQKKTKPVRAVKKPAALAARQSAAKSAARPKPVAQVSKDKRHHLKLPWQPAVAKPAPAEPLPKPVPPIGRAILIVPENDKFTDSQHPTFRWLSVGGATRYEITWSADPAFQPAHTLVSIATEATVPVEKPLRVGELYHWHVRGGNESGWGPWSNTGSFSVLEETE